MNNIVVGDLIQIKSFNEQLKLVTKNNAGINKTVSHVTIMEAPDFYEWVTGGEFVLTTWYAFSINPSIQIENFKKLAHNISAIGIKTGRFIQEIPQEIISIAEEYNIAIFEVATQAKFREIVQIISSEIQNYQTNLLISMNDYYQEIMHLSLCSDNVAPLLSLLTQKTNSCCFCLGIKYDILGYKSTQMHSREHIISYAEYIKKHWQTNMDSSIGYLNIDMFHIFLCQGSSAPLGLLVIINKDILTEEHRLLSQQTASFISLKLLDNYETKQKELANLWNRFLSGKYKERLSDFEQQLHEYGLQINDGYTIIIFKNNDRSYKLANFIEQYISSNLIFSYADKIIMLVAGDKHSAPDNEWFQKINKNNSIIQKNDLIIISPRIKNATKLFDSYIISKNTFRFFKRYCFNGIFFSDNYLLANMLLQSSDTAEYIHLQEQIVKPLKHYDESHNADLFLTLINSLFNNTLEESAKSLHIHINTLRYRLNKVEEITNKNFFNINDRYLLMVACLLSHRIQNKLYLSD